MAPRVQRVESPRQQVVSHYRQEIMDGRLTDGDKLPTVREIVDEWGISSATVVKALAALQAEGLIRTTRTGTYVSSYEDIAFTPRDRFFAIERTGRIYPPSDRAKIVSAELITAPPDHVLTALELERGTTVLRRERITYHGEQPVLTSVSWMSGELAEAVPELLSADRIPGGTVGRVREATGRQLARGLDQFMLRPATPEEAAALGLPPESMVLGGTNVWRDTEDRVLEYGEFASPPRRRFGYEYRMGDEP
jgi:DNA-binding GntR family transcriptional regulator